MDNDKKEKPETAEDEQVEKDLIDRRNFLRGLGKWSLAVIGSVVLGSVAGTPEAKGWVNTRGSWANRAGGGGAWANRAGGGGAWVNGGGGWINRGGSWINGGGGGGWVNRGGSWINRRGY